VAPHHQGIALLGDQIDFGTHGQQHFGVDMAKRQAREHGRFDLCAQPVDDGAEFEAFIKSEQTRWKQVIARAQIKPEGV